MNLRLIKIFLPLEKKTEMDEILRKSNVDDFWHDRISDKKILIRALITAEKVEKFLDEVEDKFSDVEDFRTIILPAEASIPRLEQDQNEKKQNGNPEPERISREELYYNISANSQLNGTYLTLIILASIIGTIGLIQGNIPMVVGAMIIAPLLGPSVALSLGTVLGDFKIISQALKTLLIGIFSGFIFATLLGIIFTIDPDAPEIVLRTKVEVGDILVSLASGSVGVLAFTTGTLTSLAGVMVAVALLPPLITFGMLLGSGLFTTMTGALLLFIVNLVCINLAGIITFLLQRISPRTRWQSFKAQFFTGLAVFIWFILLLFAIGIIIGF